MKQFQNACTKNFKKYSKKVPGFVLDVDGVLWKEKKIAIPTARESLHYLKNKKYPFIILTNSGGVLEEERAKDLSTMFDVEISPKQIILSHTPMRSLVSKYADLKVLIVGSRKSPEVAKHYGFKKSIGISEYATLNPFLYPKNLNSSVHSTLDNEDPFKAVLVLHDPDDFGQDLQIAIDILRSNGIPGQHSVTNQDVNLYMSNPDFLYAANFEWPRFGQGLFKLCLETTFKKITGNDLIINQFGKPEKPSYDFASKLLHDIAMEDFGKEISEIYAIGDNPAADIRGAVKAGGKFQSVLVRSGVFKGDNCKIDPAHHVVDVIGDFVLKKF